MRSILTVLLFTASIVLFGQNSCSTALAITPGTYTVTAVDGPEAPSPICIATGVATAAEWYKYTPAQDTAITITTDLGTGTDTRIQIYTGSCGSLICVGGDDDSGTLYNLASVATLNVEANVTYRIAFDNRWTSAGFSFRLTELAPIVPAEGLVTFSNSTIPGLSGGDCVVDMNGDDLDDVVRASTSNINVQYQQAGGGFQAVNIPTTPADHSPSWSIVGGDLDGNGYTDLMYGGGQGATFMIANANGTAFTEVSGFPYIFCQRTNMVDINNDGHLDAFSCHDVDANVRFMNDGNGNLIYSQGGLGEVCGNYGSVWIDYDNDGDVDCFVAKCGCNPNDLLMRNEGNGVFTNVAPDLGLSDNHQSWSSAWGDYDNDGDLDVLIGSSSSNYHKLMMNNGNGTFENVTAGSGFDTFGGQSIEWCTHDFNNDGYLDILGGGAMMYGDGAMHFTMDNTAPSNNGVGDFNADGFLDIVSWSGAFINDGNDNNWIKINTVGTVSNKDGIGAKVYVTSALGQQMRQVKSGDAFSTMSSLSSYFGLGQNTMVEQVEIRWPSGIVDVLTDIPANSVVTVVEGLSTGISTNSPVPFNVYPNPAQDVLRIEFPEGSGARAWSLTDATGKQIATPVLNGEYLDVSDLSSGFYVLQLQYGTKSHKAPFTKL
ncbi:MAG: VCBS repeat-containing protein [Flavobacteriales bacterium]|nr:VCBS repeat-containing protein [Flavobacteriales bacterium]